MNCLPHYLAALTVILLIGMVLTRVLLLNRQGIKAMKFGNIDKKDFLIPPFVLFLYHSCGIVRFPRHKQPRILPVGFPPLGRSGFLRWWSWITTLEPHFVRTEFPYRY